MAVAVSESKSATKAAKPGKQRLLDDSDSDSDSDSNGGASFQVNEEFAKRFEHNKKREERHRRR